MKAAKSVGAQGGPSRMGILGIVFVVVHLQSCGLSCFLDDSGIVSPLIQYNLSATIQSSDGVRSEISSNNLMMFAGNEGPVIAYWDFEDAANAAREEWLRYLNRVLAERGGDEAFRAVYGTGPWCVVGEPEATATGVEIAHDDPRLSDETGDPLPTCECGEECGNPPGVVPILEVMPTTMPNVVDFGTVPVGSPSVREVTFANSGAGRLCLSPPSIHGTSANPDDFVLAAISGCTATPGEGLVVLEGSATCRFRVTFTPSAPGPRSARVPGARGCGDFVTLSGVGSAGQLTAAPAPACFTPPTPPDRCREVSIRIDNPGSATVSLISASVSDSGPERWQIAGLEGGDGGPIDLTAEPYPLGPGEFVRARVLACELAADESMLRVMHNGTDYGAPGSPTGDVDAGSPLVVRLLPPTSGCTP